MEINSVFSDMHQQQLPVTGGTEVSGESNRGDDDKNESDDTPRPLGEAEIESLLVQSADAIDSIDVEEADRLAKSAGLSIESSFFEKEITTGGHNNTNHIIVWTKNHTTDRIAELSRSLRNRMSKQQPEHRSDERWDKPKQIGERRRRIVRLKDSPNAPPEAPPSAYTLYLSLMTTKIRHESPDVRHSQPVVVQEVSKLWRIRVTEVEREHYQHMCERLQEEHRVQSLEFRATGSYTPSQNFVKLGSSGCIFVHKNESERNELEREISGYETVDFPLRPPQYDEEYERKLKESSERRKKKLQEARKQRREERKKLKQANRETDQNSNSEGSSSDDSSEAEQNPEKRARMQETSKASQADDDDSDEEEYFPADDVDQTEAV